MTRDSAGIRIVENAGPQWNDRSAWRLSDSPVQELGGGIEGDPDQHFAIVRRVMRFDDGRIMVADAGNFILAFFDSSGRRVARAGGQGRGPGELGVGLMSRIMRCAGDSIFVYGRNRVTVFAPSGEYARTFMGRPPPQQFFSPRVCHHTGIVSEMRQFTRTSPGFYRDSVALGFFSADGEFQSSLDTLPVQDRTYIRGGEGVGFYPTPFGRTLSVAGGTARFATGIGDAFQVELRDSTGTVREIYRVPHRARALTSADIGRYRDFVFAGFVGNPDERRRMERELSGSNLPDTWPAFAELQFDQAGNIWVRHYDHFDAVAFFNYAAVRGTRDVRPRAMPDAPRTWTVLDPGGVLLGEVRTPAGLVVHEIGDDWMLGVWRDELDVDRVRLYRIIKPAA